MYTKIFWVGWGDREQNSNITFKWQVCSSKGNLKNFFFKNLLFLKLPLHINLAHGFKNRWWFPMNFSIMVQSCFGTNRNVIIAICTKKILLKICKFSTTKNTCYTEQYPEPKSFHMARKEH